jgi:hypothetical protein
MSSKKNPQDFKKKKPKQIATAASWGKKKQSTTVDLDLPSGNTVLVKRVDLPTLLASGAFPDSLMAIVSDKIGSATGKPDAPKEVDAEKVKEVANDPKQLAELFEAVDKIVPLVVAQPVVEYHKRPADPDSNEMEIIPDEDRDEEVVYTDDVDLMDKMHIFQFAVGGTREVETFRAGLESSVADI